MKKLMCIVNILFFIRVIGFSLPQGAEFLYLPITPESMSIGFSGVFENDISGNFILNPALSAHNRSLSFYSTYSYVYDLPYFFGGVSIPFWDFTFSSAVKIAGNYSSPLWGNAGSIYSGIFGLSKNVAPNFSIGFNFSFLSLTTPEIGDVAYSAGTGIFYKTIDILTSEKGFCLKNNRLGIVIDGVGKQAIYTDRSGIPPLSLRFGLETTFFDYGFFSSRASSEIVYDFLTGNRAISLGLDFSFANMFGLKGGYTFGNGRLGNYVEGILPFTFGAYYRTKVANVSINLFYSFSSFVFQKIEGQNHTIGMEIQIPLFDNGEGVLLTMGEEHTNHYAFSPNFDGEKDFVPFYVKLKTRNLIEYWELNIFDTNGKIVRKFSDGYRNEYNLAKLFESIFKRKESIPVPEKIYWDGLSDMGSVLPEGKYFAIFSLVSGNVTNSSSTNFIELDVTPPFGEISVDDLYFSPNGDGVKDNFVLHPSLSLDLWELRIMNEKDELILITNLKGETLSNFVWDGKNKNGGLSSEGLYDFIFLGVDKAGNKGILYINDVLLSLKKFVICLSFSKKKISFSVDNFLLIKPYIYPSLSTVRKYTLFISDEKNRVVRKFDGGGELNEIKWDGRDENGRRVDDGYYYFHMKAILSNGEKAESESYKVYVDSTPPRIVKFKLDGIPFSPDGDGNNDLLHLSGEVKDNDSVNRIQLVILDPDGREFKYFNVKNNGRFDFDWDGRSHNGELVESARIYDCILEASDEVGNTIREKVASIPTDILVEKIDLGYRIRINSIEFEFDRYDILPKSLPILKRVSEILKKFPDYKIEIHGHTDNIGSKKYNLSLSEKRAESVLKALVREGISPNRMKTKGFGFQFPVADNATEEGRRKNRRVEFILKR